PAVVTLHEVAGLEARVFRLHDLSDRPAHHELARIDALRVRLHAADAAAHVRIEREVDRATEHLAVLRCRQRLLDDLEVARLRRSDGTALEDHAAGGHGRHSSDLLETVAV